MTCQLKLSFDAIKHLTQSGLDSSLKGDDIDDEEDDDDDAASDDKHDESNYGISFYVDLLMNLSPSLEQVYSQAIKDEEQITSMVSSVALTSHVAQLPPLSVDTDGEKDQNQSLKIGLSTLTNETFVKSLQQRFTELMQTSSKKQDKKLWPKIPIPPVEASVLRFQNSLHHYATTVLSHDNPVSCDEAMSVIPLHDIYREAENSHCLQIGAALSLGPTERPQWGYHDCAIYALLRYALVYCRIAYHEAFIR